MTQQSLEPLIRERAQELGEALRYATELVSFEQDAGGVTAGIRNVVSGETDTVRAKYMVAADGNRSPVRERLGIGTSGHGLLPTASPFTSTPIAAPPCAAGISA